LKTTYFNKNKSFLSSFHLSKKVSSKSKLAPCSKSQHL
jgi:hypothetical protein